MSITINCPKCSSGLKLPDRKLLGRKGKCPKCQHRFILEEPDEVVLELAEPEAPAEPQAPLVGTSAKWVPDEPTEPAFQLADNFSGADKSIKTPFDFDSADATTSGGSTHELDFAVAVPPDSQEGGVASRVRSRRHKRRTGPVAIGIGTALLAFCMLGLWWQQSSEARQNAEQTNNDSQPKVNPEWQEQKAELASSNEDAKSLSPTDGQPIPMELMPVAPHLVFHIRPADVWANNRAMAEFRASLGDPGFGRWLEDSITSLTRFEPNEIDELTIAINFGARTAAPDVVAVARLVSDHSDSEFQQQRFKGKRLPDPSVQIYQGESHSYMVVDSKTFVVAPASMSETLAETLSFSRQPSVQMESLLKESDRQRQMTLLFDVANIDTHREYIFMDGLQTLADKFVLWFGTDVQTVSWSFHLTSDNLYMETLLGHSNTSSPLKVQRHMKGQLQDLPTTLTEVARFMKPATVGHRQMIGRFPAMMKATTLGTRSFVGGDYVRLLTLLPRKAAPNLAAASLYTWNQSLVTDFDGPATVASAGPKIPDKIIDRLKMPVFIDFRGTPLQEALAYIGDEIKTPFEINGDGLKQAALTQNMRQNHNLGEVTALQALNAIITNPDYRDMMVMSVDEAGKKIIVTSRPAAEAEGLPIFDTSAP